MHEIWWFTFINLKLKLYRIFLKIASLPCYLFVFVSLPVMIVFYTGADEIAGKRAPQWATGVLDRFTFECFVFFLLLMYILTPYEEGYLFEIQIW